MRPKVKNNQLITLVLALVAAVVYIKDQSNTGGGNSPIPQGTAAIAEYVHRSRAAKQAALYRDVASRIRSGVLADASAAGTEIVKRVSEIEQETAAPLSADAAANLPSSEWGDKEKAAAWFESAASGFERVAK